jgi:pimeloyl-ACP methyl ester carboxylesterase
MPKTRVGTIELCYETTGDPSGSPVLLIMGLGAQLIFWDDELVQRLADRGHYVIRFDNRDAGQSTHLSQRSTLSMLEAVMHIASGQKLTPPYSLDDMADDAVGLLDALGVSSAHVVGVSMGGMIAQIMSLRSPSRVRSLTSIMSTTNDRHLPGPKPEVMQALMSLMSGSGVGNSVDNAVNAFRTLASPGFPFDEQRIERRIKLSAERGFTPAGVARQFLAVLSTPGRGQSLRALKAPTLVIHGDGDPLIPPAAGQATADAVPGARLWMVPGMGHDIPTPLLTSVADAIADHAAQAEAAQRS